MADEVLVPHRDVKLLFGGAVVKTAEQQQFVPYASMALLDSSAHPPPALRENLRLRYATPPRALAVPH